MHLLNARQAGSADEGEAVDLGQTPGDIVLISAADSELACLAGAQARRPPDAPTLRLANLLKLQHPLSVDLHVDQVVRHARLVVLRLLGGRSYWAYGLEQIAGVCRAQGIPLAALPGDDRPDPELDGWSTLDATARQRIWRHLCHGGIANAEALLAFLGTLLGRDENVREPTALLRAGLYWPGLDTPDMAALRSRWVPGRPVAALVFYRALLQAADLDVIDAMIEGLAERGLDALPVYVTSLKDEVAAATLERLFEESPPDILLNATGFAQGGRDGTPLDRPGRPVLQVVLASDSREAWAEGTRGLSPRDLAMQVALPEVDGRVLARAIAFKAERRFDPRTEVGLVGYRPEPDRVRFTAALAAAWVRLARTPPSERRVAILLANYPNRDGRIGNGVGLDVPASAARVLAALAATGYRTDGAPEDGPALVRHLLAGPTNALQDRMCRTHSLTFSIHDYVQFFNELDGNTRSRIEEKWGRPEDDPHVVGGAFALSVHRFGNIVVGVQPARGYNIDPEATYHSPDLVPPHGYLAFYAWLRRTFDAHAVVHLGKHGNLEWLPGKALALSASCFPEAALGPLPHLYPFIVNDPGEGSQAKRRTGAVIVDHLTPAMTRAGTYGPLAELEQLVDEYYEAQALDLRRARFLEKEILETATRLGLTRDLALDGAAEDEALGRLDNHLCEIKELQIRDGLHVLGEAPAGERLVDLAVALVRVPRGAGEGGDASLHRALAADLGLDGFDPLTVDFSGIWNGPRPPALEGTTTAPWRTAGDTVERIEMLAKALVRTATLTRRPGSRPRSALSLEGEGVTLTPALSLQGEGEGGLGRREYPSHDHAGERKAGRRRGTQALPSPLGGEGEGEGAAGPGDPEAATDWPRTAVVLGELRGRVLPAVVASGAKEIEGLLTALDGRFLEPGPAGAPTRGRLDVLPTGRNFFSVDSRAVPTPAAWRLGWRSAALVVERYVQEHGDWPRTIALSAWGTANMRTGGDDIAQALALMGVQPTWDPASHRVTGVEVMPPDLLGRPRVDVTLRISGFFRDAFPAQIDLLDRAVRAVAALDEPADVNPLATRVRAESADLVAAGVEPATAERRASFRVFGSKPGAYGAGLQALIDERGWESGADLARAYVAWGGYAYGAGAEGAAEHRLFERRLGRVQAVLHNQDNREHDLLDSDDYYQFEGGLTAAVRDQSGAQPAIYHNDHSRPERPVVRPLKEEIARIVRGRAANPRWLQGVMRHGYKGAFEIAATVDYLFAFAATTRVVEDHHFEALYEAWLADDEVRAFMAEVNPDALRETAERFQEAIDRGLWHPRSNRAPALLDELAAR